MTNALIRSKIKNNGNELAKVIPGTQTVVEDVTNVSEEDRKKPSRSSVEKEEK